MLLSCTKHKIPRVSLINLNKIYRRVCTRVISAYRTIAGLAAGFLARLSPLDIIATERAISYKKRCNIIRRNPKIKLADEVKSALKAEIKINVRTKWCDRLGNNTIESGRYTIDRFNGIFNE